MMAGHGQINDEAGFLEYPERDGFVERIMVDLGSQT